jgi:Zn-dependent protease
MTGRGGFRLFSVSGIRIMVHPSWIVIFALLIAILASVGGSDTGGRLALAPRWIVAFLVASLFFGSVLVHELSHALVARRYGVKVAQISLFIFGGVASLEEEAPSARAEGMISVAGPLASGLLAVGFFGIASIASRLEGAIPDVVFWTCNWLALSNLLLAGFNLIPGFPMDGGRILRAVVWGITKDFMRATKIASVLGRVVGQFVILAGLFWSLEGDVPDGIWLVLIGWFLSRAATISYKQAALERLVEGIHVGDVMEENVPVVNPNLTLDTLADQHLMTGQSGFYAVTAGDQLIGTIDVAQIRRVPRGQWTTTRVGEVMRQGDAIVTLTQPQPIMEAVSRFEQSGAAAFPVVAVDDARRLLGMITREALLLALQKRAKVQAQSARP